RFAGDGAFALDGEGWPAFTGTWTRDGAELQILTPGAGDGCDRSGRYRFRMESTRLTLDLVADACVPRRMILDRSTWRPAGEPESIPVRHIVRTAAPGRPALPAAPPDTGS